MTDRQEFRRAFQPDGVVLLIAERIRNIILERFPNVDEVPAGGDKVKLVLYSIGGERNMLCALQQGASNSCYFYVHHVPELEHERLKYSGRGKHARRIKLSGLEEFEDGDIRLVLNKVAAAAPFET